MEQQELQAIKQRFSIIGNSPLINRDIEVAVQVARTDLSVLITGESGVGKEHFPQIIHAYSSRKHGPYFAINCGAIPEGTIDSELLVYGKIPLMTMNYCLLGEANHCYKECTKKCNSNTKFLHSYSAEMQGSRRYRVGNCIFCLFSVKFLSAGDTPDRRRYK